MISFSGILSFFKKNLFVREVKLNHLLTFTEQLKILGELVHDQYQGKRAMTNSMSG
jgi:hypothetical protein